MRREERIEDPYNAMAAALQGLQADIQTAMPAIIQSFDPLTQTCTAQPCLQMLVTNPDNSKQWITIKIVVDILVIFPAGGGFTLTFPVKQGDECLLIFSSRCIDNWWVTGKISQQAELRMHDISDGFAILGARSIPRMLPNVSTTSVQLRSDDSLAYVEIAAGNVVNVVAPGGLNFTAPTITMNASSSVILATPVTTIKGDITGTGTLGAGNSSFPGEGTFNGHTVGHHTHTDPQGGTVGAPTG